MMNKKDVQLTYNVMDANKSFFYVILTNICAVLVFAVLMMAVGLLSIFGLPESAYNFISSLFQVLLIPSLFLLIIIIYHKIKNINLKTATNFDWRVNPYIVGISVLILLVCITCFFPIINMLYSLIALTGYEVSGAVAFEMNNWWQLLIGAVAYCALPAIAEEIIFRGMVLKGTLSKATPIVAITISSVAFFIMHGSLIQSFYQIVLGFLLGIIGYYTKNILYPIIFHFLNNLSVVLISYFGIGGFLNGFALTFGGFVAGIGLAILGAAIIFALVLIIKLLMKKKNADYEFVVNDNNIIVEEKQEKQNLKQFINSMSMDEKFYFYSAWCCAIIIWIFGSL